MKGDQNFALKLSEEVKVLGRVEFRAGVNLEDIEVFFDGLLAVESAQIPLQLTRVRRVLFFEP